MFEPVFSKLDLQGLERDVLEFWKRNDIQRKSMETRQAGPRYVFYEGPPTANGRPGTHHVLARAFKDIFPRYKTMRGFYSLRRGGWDTHGLPVEIEVEKKLGLTGKDQIEQFGIAEFNALCRRSAFEYIQDWERLTERIGFWVDLDSAYVTYHNEYIESVWWILRQLWEKELLYQGFKVVPYCPRCGTPLSDHEVALGYEEGTVDPSVFVRFPLADEPDKSFLVWTTTPWTLPGNVALAVNPDVMYVLVERATPEDGTERLILARDLADRVLGEGAYEVIGDYRGSELAGKRYRPLYTFMPLELDAHYVVGAGFVTTEDGTGLVHLAPAFGQDDMQLSVEHGLPVLMTIDPRGRFVDEVRPWRGLFFKDADPLITRDLADRGLLFKAETYTHTYPFCWRCGTPLLYYARSTWYVETTRVKQRLTELNDTVHWYPEHIRSGRFGNWLANNVDWALGRERYWGTPLPVWVCDQCGHPHCIGSVKELSELTGRDQSALDLHRPYVDAVTFTCPKCGQGVARRVPELIDVWFDSGAMPLAQWHYPFENAGWFADQFPADYICEAVDQTRGWFYSLHAISTMLSDSVAFKNVMCLGLILDGDGQKMSKSKGNIVDPWSVLDTHGADAFRWYLYTATPPGNERRFSADLVGEVVRTFMLTLWNVYSFFVTYANLDGWEAEGTRGNNGTKGNESRSPGSSSSLDQWILSELHALVRDVTAAYEAYDVTAATRPVQVFVDNLSNWYLRRSRRRFWKSGSDADKDAAYGTLHECLVTVAKLLAPAMPFMPEAIYRNLSVGAPDAVESVHLAFWPEADPARIDEELNASMRLVQRLASLGHAARNKAGRKVRQPLAEAAFALGNPAEAAGVRQQADLLADELNVKRVIVLDQPEDAVAYSLNPLPQKLGRKHGANFPKVRAALLALDPAEAALVLMRGEPLTVQVDGAPVEVLPDEVEVRQSGREGYAVAAEGGLLAALQTTLTDDLVLEGLAREFVRRVQDLRKTAGFDIADRIVTHYLASPRLEQAVAAHAGYIQAETLSVELTAGPAPERSAKSDDTFDGETVSLGLVKQ